MAAPRPKRPKATRVKKGKKGAAGHNIRSTGSRQVTIRTSGQ